MKNPVVRAAGILGRAVGAFKENAANKRRGVQAAFISAMAEAGKWLGGQWQRRGAQKRAMQNSWLYTAVELISREVSAARFHVYTEDGNGDRTLVPGHSLDKLLRRPNPYIGRAFLWIYSILWLLLDGNFYWYIAMDPDTGEPSEIWPLPANDVEVFPGGTDAPDRFVDFYRYTANATPYDIPAEYIVHVRLPNPFDIFRGLSPLIAAMLPVDSDMAMAMYNGRFFGRDNTMPSAVINLSSGDPNTPIDPLDADQLKADLRSEYAAGNRKTAITTAQQIQAVLLGWSAKDMDFFQGRSFSKEEIWSIYGIPGGLLDKNSTEANSTTADRIFKEKTIWPMLILVAESLTAALVIPNYGEQYEAGFEDMRPANRQQDLHEIQVAGPYLTADEVRARYFKETPLPDGRGKFTAAEGSHQAAATAAEAQLKLGPGYPKNKPNPIAETGGSPNPTPTSFKTIVHVGDERILGVDSIPVYTPVERPDWMVDIRKWREKSLKAFKSHRTADVPFASETIPRDMERWIRFNLRQAQDLDQVKASFSLRPWSDFEARLITAIQAFLNDQAEKLAARLQQDQSLAAVGDETFWAQFRRDLYLTLIPQFVDLVNFGQAQGMASLEMNADSSINWNLVNQSAKDWVANYTFDLVDGLVAVTRSQLQTLFGDYAEQGFNQEELVKRIESITDPAGQNPFNHTRATAIAQTEATRMYAEGNIRAWVAAGATPPAYKPPAHPRCRCYLQPKKMPDGERVIVWYTMVDELVCELPLQTPWGEVAGCHDLHMTVISEGHHMGEKIGA